MPAPTPEELVDVLNSQFGWNEFKLGQLDVIQRLLGGDSTLAVFPTGGGKSLCYQLPALMLDGLTVVVSPLIALMKDQIDQLQARGIEAIRLDSSLTKDEYRSAAQKIRNGTAKLLYVAPERFFNERFRGSLSGIPISMFAIDEAHCISQWGHNFRPDYLKMASIAEELKVERVLALTATATPEVQEDISRAFEIQPDNVICTQFFRPNLHLRTKVITETERLPTLVDRLKTRPPGSTIAYVSLQRTAESIAAACTDAGLDARAYHAGMENGLRAEIQDWFMQGENKIVVATIAFGMGIDKSNIRYIYHLNPPKSIESYVQEIGRAGRDGLESTCELLLVPEDRIVIENFSYSDTPTQDAIERFFDFLSKQPDEFFVSQYKISNQCDLKSLVTKTFFTYLELDGFLRSTTVRYDSYQFKPLVSSSEILDHFSGERREFVKRILTCSQKRKIWFDLDLPATMEKLGTERSRIVSAVDYLAEKGWLELKVTGLVHGYQKLKPTTSSQLVETFSRRIEEREQGEVNRTQQVFDLARASSCQAATLSAYFGQPLESDCGACSFCMGQGNLEIPELENVQLTDEVTHGLAELTKSHGNTLNSSRAIARFLCGMTSPSLTRAKLTKQTLFGSCQEIPFGDLMQQAEAWLSKQELHA